MALCEFGCPSLEYVYDMSWAEFRIRQFAYNRQQKEELFRVREIAYASIIGPHLVKVPTKEQYMPLEGKKEITEIMKEKMRGAVLKYKEEKNAKSSITSPNRSENNRPRKKPRQSPKKPSKI